LLTGTFDPDHPRNRIIRALIDAAGWDVIEHRAELWGDVRYSKMSSQRARTAWRGARAYVSLLARAARAPRPDLVMMLYPGHIDMLVLGPLWRLRGVPVIFDPLISLFDTITEDRRLSAKGSLLGRVSMLVDKLSFRLANLVVADTRQVADHYAALIGIDRAHIAVLLPGADEATFAPGTDDPSSETDVEPDLVLFNGTFIALHGLETIVRAAKLLEKSGIRFRIVGDGQERPMVEALIAELGGVGNLELVGRRPFSEIPREIARAALCLGIFGTTPKTERVVPFKVFEYLALGRPVVTADTPAMREALAGAVALVPAGDPDALAATVRELLGDRAARAALAKAGHERYLTDYGTAPLSRGFTTELQRLVPSGS
jgi:glycosyltransferase involved in cell wall biosynthesis